MRGTPTVSAKAARADKEEIIKSRHVHVAFKKDNEMSKLFESLEIIPVDDDDGNDHDSDDEDDDDEESEYCDDSNDDEDEVPPNSDPQELIQIQTTCPYVAIGTMSIAAGQADLYKRLVDKFGDIVSPDLPQYKVEPTCAALHVVLNAVMEMKKTSRKTVTQEMISYWEEMVSTYSDIGLKLGWFQDYIQSYRRWLTTCPALM
ncbi:hypothetical protein ACHQM5_000921 [Ranunculus cassubicifolius]